jgi:single-strand DNA-binding protein
MEARAMNITILQGNLGADPELRFTQSGQAVMSMRLCTSETYLDNNKVKQERNEWHSLTVWGKRAEALAKFLCKGSRILIQGRLHYSSYDDKDGIKRYKTEIVVNDLEMCGGKSKNRDDNSDDRGSSSNRGRRDDRKPDSDSGRDDGGGDDFGGGDDIPF